MNMRDARKAALEIAMALIRQETENPSQLSGRYHLSSATWQKDAKRVKQALRDLEDQLLSMRQKFKD